MSGLGVSQWSVLIAFAFASISDSYVYSSRIQYKLILIFMVKSFLARYYFISEPPEEWAVWGRTNYVRSRYPLPDEENARTEWAEEIFEYKLF